MPLISPARFDGPLVERDAQIARLEQIAESLRSGRGTVLEIAGDPGMGKTSLLAVLAGLLAGAGVRVARGHAIRGDDAPGQIFRSAWEEHPGLTAVDRKGELDPQSAGTLATGWAAGSGGAVVLDDVQWCDPKSVDIAVRLVRNPVAGPFLLVLAHRPRQTNPALLDALDDGVRIGTVTRIAVPPLSTEAMRELAVRWTGGTAAHFTGHDEAHDRRLGDAAGGSPRNLRILLAGGWDPVLWPFQAGGDPGGLLREAAALTTELDLLSPEAGVVLRGAAVLGDPFRPEDVTEVCELTADRVLAALAELTEADLVRRRGNGEFVFRDPVLGHVAHEHSSLSQQTMAHRRALDLLVGRGAAASALARHAEQLLGTDSATAAPILARAAAEVVASDPAAAAHWSGLALDHIPHGGQARAELEILQARALIAVGRLDEARTLVHEVLGHVSELPWQIALRAYGAAADVERLLCRYSEAEAIAATALGLLPAPGEGGALPLEAVTMIYEYALVQSLRGDHIQARAMIRSAVDMTARPVHPTEIAIRCLAVCQDAYMGNVAVALEEARQCTGVVDALADPQAGQAPEMFVTLGAAGLYLERFEDASRHLKRGLKVASGGTQLHVVLHGLLGLASVDLFTGRLDTIAQWAGQAEQLASDIGSQEGVGLAKSIRASSMIWTQGRRDVREILALAESAIADVESHRSWWALSALGLAAQVQLLGGDPEGALRTMLERADGQDVAVAQPALEPSLKGLMAMAALRCGDLPAARRWTEDAEAAASRLSLTGQTAGAIRARAALHLADGRPDLAVDLFAQAADRFDRAGAPIQRVWTQAMGAAAADAAQGHDAALVWLDAASAAADALGALSVREDTARARAELATGSRPEGTPARPDDDGPLGMLSEREREIAALAAAGLRSREIAQRLFLSPRTVEAHLGRVYRRLGVSSRGELPRIIGNRGGEGSADTAQ
ncbi:transcriptional regulator, LuxR family [Catenulispora acidiphila DSM 44928]|uniref:Transcriptional regulator, LuxR family n=1 Tax=Catenulispora acidiphila (strain DSM 44928 / JCM 14897 / NBRC 102108 / NRRL B-24433 / ID139908) TaxID=479433 RepID=C7QG31_CATAD|nr:LuxR family transcriptional regulator [Catenulispora acidiphila]ACU71008.1 transcriptional regulator, LuxR family [Catenulispora acidiphila DSM 44928]